MACSDTFSSGILVTKGIEMREPAQMSILNIEKPNAADSRGRKSSLAEECEENRNL